MENHNPTTEKARIVYVIPCAAAKMETTAPAADFYTGSMFRVSIASAIAQGDGEVLILSALHGLIALDQDVAPYDVKMGDRESIGAAELAAQVVGLGLDGDNVDVYSMLPNAYHEALDCALRGVDSYAIPVFEASRGIGDHRKICRIIRETTQD